MIHCLGILLFLIVAIGLILQAVWDGTKSIRSEDHYFLSLTALHLEVHLTAASPDHDHLGQISRRLRHLEQIHTTVQKPAPFPIHSYLATLRTEILPAFNREAWDEANSLIRDHLDRWYVLSEQRHQEEAADITHDEGAPWLGVSIRYSTLVVALLGISTLIIAGMQSHRWRGRLINDIDNLTGLIHHLAWGHVKLPANERFDPILHPLIIGCGAISDSLICLRDKVHRQDTHILKQERQIQNQTETMERDIIAIRHQLDLASTAINAISYRTREWVADEASPKPVYSLLAAAAAGTSRCARAEQIANETASTIAVMDRNARALHSAAENLAQLDALASQIAIDSTQGLAGPDLVTVLQTFLRSVIETRLSVQNQAAITEQLLHEAVTLLRRSQGALLAIHEGIATVTEQGASAQQHLCRHAMTGKILHGSATRLAQALLAVQDSVDALSSGIKEVSLGSPAFTKQTDLIGLSEV